jgi:hypothetical protein
MKEAGAAEEELLLAVDDGAIGLAEDRTCAGVEDTKEL